MTTGSGSLFKFPEFLGSTTYSSAHNIQQEVDWNALQDTVNIARKLHGIHWRMECTVRTDVCSGGMEGR